MGKKLNLKLIVIIILLFLQTLCFSIEQKEITELDFLQKEELQNEIKKLEEQLAENKNDYDVITKLGIAYQFLTSKYQQKVSGKNEQYLAQSLKIKKNPVVQAYLGASYLIKGKNAINPMNKMKYVKEGSKIIDGAVKKDPDNFIIRIIRINTSSGNKKMGRLPIAKEDIDYCEDMYKAGKLTEIEYAKLLFSKGRYYDALEDKAKAKEVFNKIINDYPNTEPAKQAKKMMDKI